VVLDLVRNDVYAQLEAAHDEIRDLKARLAALSQSGISSAGHPLTTPLEFAKAHRVSVSTVNRALNAGDLLGIRQPNNRWLVDADQPYSPKRNRG
jgi:hypothetical protein